jgi:hypothetical protein
MHAEQQSFGRLAEPSGEAGPHISQEFQSQPSIGISSMSSARVGNGARKADDAAPTFVADEKEN